MLDHRGLWDFDSRIVGNCAALNSNAPGPEEPGYCSNIQRIVPCASSRPNGPLGRCAVRHHPFTHQTPCKAGVVLCSCGAEWRCHPFACGPCIAARMRLGRIRCDSRHSRPQNRQARRLRGIVPLERAQGILTRMARIVANENLPASHQSRRVKDGCQHDRACVEGPLGILQPRGAIRSMLEQYPCCSALAHAVHVPAQPGSFTCRHDSPYSVTNPNSFVNRSFGQRI
jgi:hypothetical protein